MHVQVLHGRTVDPDGVRDAVERWRPDLAPSVASWLGATAAYTHMTGDPHWAGFVQVIQGRTSDRRRFRELLRVEEPLFALPS